jgi:hypothetical protein
MEFVRAIKNRSKRRSVYSRQLASTLSGDVNVSGGSTSSARRFHLVVMSFVLLATDVQRVSQAVFSYRVGLLAAIAQVVFGVCWTFPWRSNCHNRDTR